MTHTPNIAQPIDQNAYSFSEELMQLISNIYSPNTEEAYASFQGLINYFKGGSATIEEREFLVITNANPIVDLLNALQHSNPEPYELLRQIVGKVVTTTAQENLNNDDFDSYSDDFDSESDEEEIEIIGNDSAPVDEEEIDIIGDYSETDA